MQLKENEEIFKMRDSDRFKVEFEDEAMIKNILYVATV